MNETGNPIGMTLGGRYHILRQIGKGGMAVVYLADDAQEGRQVAVKILRSELTSDAAFVRRFDTEAQAASSLSHQNIVKVFDVGQQDEMRYIVMEYIEGVTLKQLIQQKGRIPWETAVPLAIQIGLALDHAHRNGIVHRDIKPHNILLTPQMTAKVADFGIARAASANTITMTGGAALGSVHYFSPEQARGTIVGEKSDIYSLGILLYEMLTGKVPFDGDSAVAIAIMHIQDPPVPPTSLDGGIPTGLEAIVLKCIQKNPENRYSDVRALVDELDALMVDPSGIFGVVEGGTDLNGSTTLMPPMRHESNFDRLRDIEASMTARRRARRRDAALVVLAFLILLGGVAYGGYQGYLWVQGILNPTSTADFLVEDYVGKNIDDIKVLLDNGRIAYEVKYVQSDTIAVDVIISQNIQAGMRLKPDGASTMALTVSSGKDTLKIADYTGQNYRLVELELTQKYGLKVSIKRKMSPDLGKDSVITTEPGPGNDVAKGGEVTLYVSDGLTKVRIPTIIGMKRLDALDELAKLNLVLAGDFAMSADLPAEQQYVVYVNPSVGTQVSANTGVDIYFGSYADYQFSLTPTIAETPTPTPGPTDTPAPIETPTPEPTLTPTDVPAP